MRLAISLILAAGFSPGISIPPCISSSDKEVQQEGFEYLPFWEEKFELPSTKSTLRELDRAIGEAFEKFLIARSKTPGLIEAPVELAGAEKKAKEELIETLEKAKANARDKGDSEGLMALTEALDQLAEGKLPHSRTFLKNSPDKEATKFKGHSYKVFSNEEDRVPWPVARKRCRQKGGYLACVESREELDFLVNLLGNSLGGWVGGSIGDDAVWSWVTGESVDHSLWHENEPNREEVVFLRPDYGLGDALAGFRWRYICEWGESLPYGWDFNDSGARKAVVDFKKAMNKASSKFEDDKESLEKKLARARTAFRNAAKKAVTKAKRDLNKSSSEATRADRVDEIKRIAMVVAALGDDLLFPDPPLFPNTNKESVDALEGAHRFGYSTYKVIEEKIGWHEAVRRCEELGGRLAHVKIPHQQHFLIERVLDDNSAPHLWLGASDEEDEGEWRWLDGSSMFPHKCKKVGAATVKIHEPLDYEGYQWFEDDYGGFEHFLMLENFKTHGQWRDQNWLYPPQPTFVCEWIYQ
ncbi:MAG TPA: hypothetical protein EYF98_03745 [Planctomycetes bacterium]|nr:hypothetical protein [Planctomycetota bacterium]